MIGTAKRVSKFTFTYHDLAYKVRENMLNALQQYDINYNGLFEQNEICQALVNILDQDQNQLRYVISNVFRYDKDGDRAVTYDQFVNFAVEQHFGQMAIQRLHRNGIYSRGNQRVMNFKEFEITLNQSLKHIASEGSTEEYQHLFNQVDLDQDGWIKYEDYFMFLRQYFGSLSFAANNSQGQPHHQQPPARNPEPEPYQPRIEFAEERLARLIYTQLKVTVMQHDLNKSLSLKRNQIESILVNLFRIPAEQKDQLANLILGDQTQIGYQKFMKVIVPFYFCEYDVQKSNINQTTQDQFVYAVRNSCVFIRVKPSEVVLRQIFNKSDVSRKGFLQRNQYINTLGLIMENYQFDTRGLGNAY